MTSNSPESDQTPLEIQLAHAKQINELLLEAYAAFSSEFRTPLTTALMFTELLLEDEEIDQLNKPKQYITHIRSSTQQVFELYEAIRNIIFLFRSSYQPETIDLVAYLKEIKPDYSYQLAINNNLIPDVWIDKYLIRHVLDILFYFPLYKPSSEQKISLNVKNNKHHVTLNIEKSSDEKFHFSKNALAFRSCQTAIELQQGYLSWNQPSENTLEFKLGLPTINEEKSL